MPTKKGEGKDVSASPTDVSGRWLQNQLDPEVVDCMASLDATYMSLNSDSRELSNIMPWTGTSMGRRRSSKSSATCSTRRENRASETVLLLLTVMGPTSPTEPAG
jgi:hypothetical protein